MAALVLAPACGPGYATVLIEGSVMAAATQAPIAGARVMLAYEHESAFGDGALVDHTDALGRYEFDLLQVRCSNLTLIVSAAGFRPAHRANLPCNSQLQHYEFALELE